jgi:hypothetical protein
LSASLLPCAHPRNVRLGDAIRRFRDDLLAVIDRDPYGEPFIERFALDNPVAAGHTLIQAITTSSITAHF